jgi:hypothetical protein
MVLEPSRHFHVAGLVDTMGAYMDADWGETPVGGLFPSASVGITTAVASANNIAQVVISRWSCGYGWPSGLVLAYLVLGGCDVFGRL